MKERIKGLVITIAAGIGLITMSWNNLNTMRLTSFMFLGLIVFIYFKTSKLFALVSGDEQ